MPRPEGMLLIRFALASLPRHTFIVRLVYLFDRFSRSEDAFASFFACFSLQGKPSYCRIFLAKANDAAACKFEDYLMFFERRVLSKVRVFRTDGRGEYNNADLFYKRVGVGGR